MAVDVRPGPYRMYWTCPSMRLWGRMGPSSQEVEALRDNQRCCVAGWKSELGHPGRYFHGGNGAGLHHGR